ncbi:MAG: type II glyceraldehyde-3-phosphate dehydrogenase [Candidatus Aminicenantes bacterium]|nr:type II glyceraldehyde-3-phosphate dehydrogenase [Candidatus Aminicenantes bacterium]
MVKVLGVGYGVVGKRVADAVALQDDMEVCGVVDVAPTSLVAVANERKFPLYGTSPEAIAQMRKNGLKVEGTFSDILKDADIVVDTAPTGVTAKNVLLYEEARKPFIINGGEKHETTGFSFSSLANYREAVGIKKTRIVSCNTTAICRVLVALKSAGVMDDVYVNIVRRGADPVKTSSGPINAIIPVLGGFSHHAPDVKTVMPDIRISSAAVKVSSTLSHIHILKVTYKSPINKTALVEAFEKTPRIILVSGEKGITSNAHVLELFRDKLRPRNDMWEVAIWEDSISVEENTAVLIYCVHMEAIAVPENVDAIRAMLGIEKNPAIAISKTDKAMGLYQENANYDKL